MPRYITVRVNGLDYALQPSRIDGSHSIRLAESRLGGCVLAEVTVVHTHKCVSRRWGRRNHHKECSCGASDLELAMNMRGPAL